MSKSRSRGFMYHLTHSNTNAPTPKDDVWNLGWTDTVTGGTNPSWRDKIARAENATTTFTGSRRTIECSSAQGSVSRYDMPTSKVEEYSTSGTAFHFLGDWPLSFSFEPTNSADNQALQSLYKQIRRSYQQTQIGVTVGEWRETMKMIRNPAKAIRKGIDEYSRRVRKNVRGVKSKSKSNHIVAETWLEYTFGWKPLINDVRDAAKAAARMSAEITRNRIIGKGEVEKLRHSSTVRGVRNNYIHFTTNKVAIARTEVRYIAGMQHKLDTGWTDRMQNVFGLTAWDIVPTIWELIPYSFLVDYFTNIGDLISASCTDTRDVRWICKTYRQWILASASGIVDTRYIQQLLGPGYRGSSGTPGTEYQTVSQVSRVPVAVGDLPLPRFELSIPGLDSAKWINIPALAAARRL